MVMFWVDLERGIASHKGSSVSDTEKYTEYIIENTGSRYSLKCILGLAIHIAILILFLDNIFFLNLFDCKIALH